MPWKTTLLPRFDLFRCRKSYMHQWNLLEDSIKFSFWPNSLSAPSSDAKVERFFNYLKLVKTDWRCSLSADSLEHLLRIRVEGPDLETYSKEFVHDAVSMWWSEKQRRLVQGKRSYRKRQGKTRRKVVKMRLRTNSGLSLYWVSPEKWTDFITIIFKNIEFDVFKFSTVI